MSTRNDTPRRVLDEADRGPLLGALLRISHRAISAEIMRGLATAGYDDLEPANIAPFQTLWDAPEGVRATDLAVALRITKQSTGALVEHLEARGYVERVDDPRDRRAKLVRLTRRGRDGCRLVRAIVRRVESEWGERLGPKRLAALKETLSDLVALLDVKV
jgi:DNA-binding MarR family transcriptional regulator